MSDLCEFIRFAGSLLPLPFYAAAASLAVISLEFKAVIAL